MTNNDRALITPADEVAFNPMRLYSDDSSAIWEDAQAKANANGAPVAVLKRDGWMAICEIAEVFEDAVQYHGWAEVALVNPQDDDMGSL